MFVRSNMDIPVRYNKSTGSVTLKPNTVTYVADTLVTAKELLSCYGDRITIISNETVEEIIKEEAPVEVEEAHTEAEKEEEKEETEKEEVAEKSETGNEEVDAFLNGETDKLPEGTTEITEEEALKLQKEAEAEKEEEKEAKAKVEEEVKPAKKATGKTQNKTQSKKTGKNNK